MSLEFSQKQQVVSEVSDVLSESTTAIVAEYRGLKVSEMTGLRREARNNDVWVRVVKNTLARRAIDGTGFSCMSEQLSGPLVMAASADPVAVAKVVSTFAKGNDNFNITCGAMNGALMSVEDIQALAKLPGREELLATLVGTMQAPVAKFVRTLNEVPTSFVRVLAAVRDAREAA